MDKKTIGEAIRDKRKQKGLKQVELSERTGLSRTYISDLENGRYMPSVEALRKIAVCLEMDLNSIFLSPSMSEIPDV